MSEKTKRCPFCGEEIMEVAIKCKHCGSMLDGTGQEQKVSVSGLDPTAELHTPIKGKAKGKLTFIGKLGIGLGILIMFMAGYSMANAQYDVELEQLLVMLLIGLGFSVASYLWVRRPEKKK